MRGLDVIGFCRRAVVGYPLRSSLMLLAMNTASVQIVPPVLLVAIILLPWSLIPTRGTATATGLTLRLLVGVTLARLFLLGPPKSPQQWLLLSVLSAYIGVCWATGIRVLLRTQRGWSAAVEPGEWLLTCTGMVLALDIVIRWLPSNFPLPPNAIMAAGICEAVNLGQKCGLDTATMLETMLAGPMGCALFEFKKPMLIDDSFSAQFPLKHMTKDIRFALQTADDNGAMAPIGHTVFQLYRQSMGQGLADQDFAAVKKVFERISDA